MEQLTLLELDDWNPRYVAYANVHGRGPGEMLAVDYELHPGGHMAGFTIWLAEQWTAFGIPMGSRHVTDDEQDAFTAWLTELACAPAACLNVAATTRPDDNQGSDA